MKTKQQSREQTGGFGRGLLPLWLVAVCGIWSWPSQAQVPIYDSTNRIGEGGVVETGFWIAQSFLVPASGPYTLASVVLGLEAGRTSGGGFFVALYDDAGTQPGSRLATLNGEADPAVAGSYTYTPSGSLTLAADTPDWVVAGVESGSATYLWDGLDLPPQIGRDVGYTGSSDGGTSWDPAFGANSEGFNLQVNATAVPEPGSWAMVGLLVATGFGLWQRSRAGRS